MLSSVDWDESQMQINNVNETWVANINTYFCNRLCGVYNFCSKCFSYSPINSIELQFGF